jgi:hypothetical protein
MNNPENFLMRWFRRKHEAALGREEIVSPVAPSAAPLGETPGNERTAGTERLHDGSGILPSAGLDAAAPPFDPLSLPSIESITADTDIRRFLAPGVPLELTRAALRRAWATDPKIRDFVGLADYDWDFNAPGSMVGFGSLEMTDELRRMAVQIVGPVPSRDQMVVMRDPASANTTSDQIPGEPNSTATARSVGHEVDHGELAQNAPNAPIVERGAAHPAPQPESSRLIVRQRHGAALPKA